MCSTLTLTPIGVGLGPDVLRVFLSKQTVRLMCGVCLTTHAVCLQKCEHRAVLPLEVGG